LLGLAVLGGVAVLVIGGRGHTAPEPTAAPPATTPVTRTTLTETQTFAGTLGYGEAITLNARMPGTLTQLPPIGRVLKRGDAAFWVDNEPMIIMYGTLPAYRTLAVGDSGADVKQLEQNLRALGYIGFQVDQKFTADTAAAVKRWQKKVGLPETGQLELGRVLFTSGPLRVAEHKLRVGDPASGPVLTVTATVRVVTLDLEAKYRPLAKQGATVTVGLPDGTTTKGLLASVGSVGSNSGSGGGAGGDSTPKVKVLVTVADQGAFTAYDQGPVDVRITAQEKKDVLAVPLAALLALPGSGYGVELITGRTSRVLRVELGMFAAGQVEISGAGIREGVLVGVPSS
jgi:peptidoglycan hydrolase-like protein with peptidoglycan-binding domain